MWIHSTEQTVFNDNVQIQNRPRGSGRATQQCVLWPKKHDNHNRQITAINTNKDSIFLVFVVLSHSTSFYHIADTYHEVEDSIVTKQF